MARPPVIRDQDRIDFCLTEETEYRIPFTFIEALNEGTLADRPAHAFREAARERRLFHVLNRTTENIIGTGVIQMATGSTQVAEVGGLMFHPAARGFGLAALLVKIMMVHAIKESGRDSPDEEYHAHVMGCNGAPLHALLEAGFKPTGPVDVKRGEIDAVIDHMLKDGESTLRMEGFIFDREAIGKLISALWQLLNEDNGVITRFGPDGDILRLTVDFSKVIPCSHLSL